VRMRTPGVYQALDERKLVPVTLGPTGVAGFVGLAQRGPTNAPVRVTSVEQFRAVYGQMEEEGYLAPGIQGFFDNGGKVCYVLRVAHLVRRAREEVARSAYLKILDEKGNETVRLAAASEGMWGNQIKVGVTRQEPRVSTILTLDLKAGDTSATIKSTLGLRRGTLIEFSDGKQSTCRTIVELSGKTIGWDTNEPLETDFKSSAPTIIEPVEFRVRVKLGQDEEVFKNLSMSPLSENYIERVINTQSAVVRVEDQRVEGSLSDSLPVDVVETHIQNGSDGLYSVTPEDFIGANIGPEERFGIAAFEAIDEVDVLLCPDVLWALERSSGFKTERDVEVVQHALVSQCERMKTRIALLDPPDPKDHRRAGQWRLLFDSPYAAFYFPWVVSAVDGRMRTLPPSGHVAGIIARCDEEMGCYRAPANEELVGVHDVARNLTEVDLGMLNDQGINCIRPLPRRGIRVWGARTMSSDPQWRYINVRRVVNAIISSVERGLQWSVFEVNSHFLWKKLTRQISGFLMELFTRGYFAGATPEEAFFVKCDSETNPPEIRDAGIVVVECGVAPVRPAEYLIFKVEADIQEIGPETAE
jgi:phage tail sheath protein FI